MSDPRGQFALRDESSEVELLGQTYRCQKLETLESAHVGLRMLPYIMGLMSAYEQGLENVDTAALGRSLSQISFADFDFLRATCLNAVRWRQGDRWVPLLAPGGALLNGAADRLDVQLRLMGEVLLTTYRPFDPGLLLPSTRPNGMDTTALPMAAPAEAV